MSTFTHRLKNASGGQLTLLDVTLTALGSTPPIGATEPNGLPSWFDFDEYAAGTLSDGTTYLDIELRFMEAAPDGRYEVAMEYADGTSANIVSIERDVRPKVAGIKTENDANAVNTSRQNNAVSFDFSPLNQAFGQKLDSSEVGSAGGVSPLDANGKVPSSFLPAMAITEVYTVASESEQLALDVQEGDVAVRTDLASTDEPDTFIRNDADTGTISGDWIAVGAGLGVAEWNGRTGIVSPQFADYAASQIDNDSDVAGSSVKDAMRNLEGQISSGLTTLENNTYPRPTGGNARGNDSVDFQYVRDDSAQVASGDRAFIAGGQDNRAGGNESFAAGAGADAGREYQMTHASGSFSGGSLVQSCLFESRLQTSSPEPTAITDGGRLILLNDTIYLVRARVLGKVVSSNDYRAAYRITFSIERSGGTSQLLGGVQKDVIYEDGGSKVWDVGAAINASTHEAAIIVTGDSNNTIRWGASVEFLEMGFGSGSGL